MTTLERAIRPFQQTGITPPLRDPQIGPTTVIPNMVLTVGKEGAVKSFSGSFSSSESRYMDAKKKEKGRSPSRTTTTKTITSEDGSVSFDFEVTDTIWMKGPNGQWEQWTFDNSDPTS